MGMPAFIYKLAGIQEEYETAPKIGGGGGVSLVRGSVLKAACELRGIFSFFFLLLFFPFGLWGL